MVVRMRRNRSETAKRRSHHALKAQKLATCECGALRIPHRACPECGKYNGRVVIDVVARTKREQRRAKRRQAEQPQAGAGAQTETKKEEATTSA
ncbi:MAG: 50S ribosomal protein L32 [Candidatus Kaiserbacteria bacterium]|nr:MAG: 50S ribosomal protein L32 [Candidatus Kaiserbacteria bacterium]